MKFKNNGFTLIELIVVFGILGILAATTLVALNPFAQFQKANDARRKTDLSQIQKALESFYQDYQMYPSSTNGANPYLMTYTDKSGSTVTVNWGNSWQPYMNTVPKDPASGKYYIYYSPSTDRQTYYLYASLERGTAADDCKGASPCHTNACGSANCNFGVSSPNVTP